MKTDWVKQIIRNAIHEVSVQYGMPITDVKVAIEFDWSVEFEFTVSGGLKRGLTVRNDGRYCGYSVSHGIHSPSDIKSDLIQQAICGRIAERLIHQNFIQ